MNVRFRGFTAALLLASLLAGAAVALANASLTLRAAAALLTIWVCVAGAAVLTGRSRLMWLLLPCSVLAALFVVVAPEPSTWSSQRLHVAAWLAYGAIALAALLAPIRVIGGPRALLLTFSTALVLLGADFFVKPPAAQPAFAWDFVSLTDPDVQFRYAPNSTAREFFPDNPRGYFEQTQPTVADTWTLVIQKGSAATLERLSSEDTGTMRVTINKRGGAAAWNVALQQIGYHIARGTSYLLTFRARSGTAARPISCELRQSQPPWAADAEYRSVEVDTQWREFHCAFTGTANDPNARILFSLATSDAPIEFADVVLHDESTGRRAETTLLPARRFFIGYRFNSLGYRGPDYAIPRPPGTFRILALGDSYAQGFGVREPDTFEAVMQARLNRAATTRGDALHYEVINAGIGGYATRQELSSYEKFASKYDAQVVLLVMVFNDDLSYMDEVRRGFVVRADDEGGLANLVNRAKQSARTYDYTDTIAALRELEDATRTRGAKLAVVIFQSSQSEEWARLDADVTAALAGSGIPMLNLKDALVGHGYTWPELIGPDGHPNEIAHRIAAERIEQFLRTEHLLR